MSAEPKRSRRTVFDLSPQELFELRKLNLQVSASVPPKRPSYSTSGSEFSFDYGIYERYRDLHARAKAERSEWLRARRITLQVVSHAAMTDYKPYTNAARIGRVAPPLPQGYAEALAALEQEVEASRRMQQIKTGHVLLIGSQGFSF
jgi:hypothetical protein